MKRRLKSFQDLGPQFFDFQTCIRTLHYLDRRQLRGFSERQLTEILGTEDWQPSLGWDDRFVVEKDYPGDGRWKLVIAVDSDFKAVFILSVTWSPIRSVGEVDHDAAA